MSISPYNVQFMKITGYTIEGQIGQGGMARVYRAIQDALGRPVALKIMNPLFADDPAFSERFLDEGRLLASMRHPHIMTIYDIGVSDGFHYISMEYVDGGDLKQRIRDGLSPDAALDHVNAIASGLKAAHNANIVHRCQARQHSVSLYWRFDTDRFWHRQADGDP
jgi:serine/threonine protein kinase